MSNQITFAAWAPAWDPNSGGNICLHKLCNDLNNLGEEAYILQGSVNPNYNERWHNGQGLDPETTIFVYPEITVGNPYGGKHVARWLLNSVGTIGGNAASWAPDDMVFRYCEYFTAPGNWKIQGDLRTLDTDINFWATDLGLKREGNCHLVKKGAYKNYQHKPGSQGIDHIYNREDLRYIFNTKEVYVSSDHASYHSVQAALAGCLSIVVPDGINNARQWRKKFPQHKYGIAYGFDFDEIKHASETRHLLKDHIQSLEDETIVLVKRFVEICKERIGG